MFSAIYSGRRQGPILHREINTMDQSSASLGWPGVKCTMLVSVSVLIGSFHWAMDQEGLS